MGRYRIMLRQSVKYAVDVEAENEEDAAELAREYLCDCEEAALVECEMDATDFQSYACYDAPPNFKADVVQEAENEDE